MANTSSGGDQGMPRFEQATNALSALNPGAETFQSENQLLSAASIALSDQTSDTRPMNRGVQMYASAISLDDILLEPDQISKLFYM